MRRTTLVFASVAMGLGLAAFAPSAAAAGYWVCRDGVWVGVGGPGHPRPARPCGERPAIPKSEADCLHAGGRWGRAGLFPKPICVLRTGDAGRVCGDGDECEGTCLVDAQVARGGVFGQQPSGPATGVCTRARPVFGCMIEVTRGHIGRRICLD